MSEYELLERRVAAVEQEVEGEKLVTRHILEQTRRNSDDLATIKARQKRHDERFDRLESEFSALKSEFGGLKNELQTLRRDLPGIVAEVMREVLREQKG